MRADPRRQAPPELYAPLDLPDMRAAARLARRLAELDRLIAQLERRGLQRNAEQARAYRADLERRRAP